MPRRRPIADRFHEKVNGRGEDECWEWQARRNKDGYGRFNDKVDGRVISYLAHRLAWELAAGPIPDGLCVLHKCDNPPCCNPGHLFLGTNFDNQRDCVSKGRRPPQNLGSFKRGHLHPKSKLTEWAACGVVARWLQGVSQSQVAREFGVRQETVGKIVRGEVWVHLFARERGTNA